MQVKITRGSEKLSKLLLGLFSSLQTINPGRDGETHADGPRKKTLTALLCSSVCWGQRWDLPGHNVALCTASHTLPGDKDFASNQQDVMGNLRLDISC